MRALMLPRRNLRHADTMRVIEESVGAIMTIAAKNDRFTREMTETIEGMRAVGVMDEEAYKLTMHDLNGGPPADTVTPVPDRKPDTWA